MTALESMRFWFIKETMPLMIAAALIVGCFVVGLANCAISAVRYWAARWVWVSAVEPPPEGETVAVRCGDDILVGWYASDWKRFCKVGSRDLLCPTGPEPTHWRRYTKKETVK